MNHYSWHDDPIIVRNFNVLKFQNYTITLTWADLSNEFLVVRQSEMSKILEFAFEWQWMQLQPWLSTQYSVFSVLSTQLQPWLRQNSNPSSFITRSWRGWPHRLIARKRRFQSVHFSNAAQYIAIVHFHISQLLCSIEKAVWKLAQSGLSTAAKIYYYRIFYTSTFFSNGRISETKQDFLNALVPKFSYRRGLSSPLSWKWPRPTLSSSFSLFLERKHFFEVFQVGQIGPLRFKTYPWDPYWWWRKKIYGAS